MDWPALPVWWNYVWRAHHRWLGPQALKNLPWGIHESQTGERLQISNSVSSVTAVQWVNTTDIIARVSQCVWDVPHYLLKCISKSLVLWFYPQLGGELYLKRCVHVPSLNCCMQCHMNHPGYLSKSLRLDKTVIRLMHTLTYPKYALMLSHMT